MCDNQGTEYSGVITNTMPPTPDRLYSGLGVAAFRSTDGMDAHTVARFWAKVDRRGPDECWPWLASTNGSAGYGVFVATTNAYAHRVAYELVVGPIPSGLQLDHLCRNRACVNPAHLEPVTSRENTLRGMAVTAANAAKTHCKHGHEFTERNTRLTRLGRDCRECERLRSARRRAAA